jgi:glyoxylase-like metal-dependent hydrolase (beta-lactamase superfamily II)
MTEVGTRDIPPLNWDVLVTPGIPIATSDLPPGMNQALFQAIAWTLIYGKPDAVLVDAFMTVTQADALVDWVAASGKNLTTIYITHGHGDHWFGIGALLERFPNARAVATPDVVRVMHQHASQEILEKVWKAGFPGQIPDRLMIAEELNYISFEEIRYYLLPVGNTM